MNFKTLKFKELKRAEEPLYKSPTSLQENIDIMAVSESGVFQLHKDRFSKCYVFSDANYLTLGGTEKENFFLSYCKFLNSFDVDFKITINSKDKDMDAFREEMMLPEDERGYGKTYNNVIREKLFEGKQGIEQEKYLTISITRSSFEEARETFATIEANLHNGFNDCGSSFRPLTGDERLQMLFDFYHLGEKTDFKIDLAESIRMKTDWVNDVCNGMIKYRDTYFQTENIFGRSLYIRRYPAASMPDDFLKKLTSLPIHSVVSIDCVPVPKEMINEVLEQKYLSIENNIAKQQERRNKDKAFSLDISYKRRKEKEEVEEMMEEIGDSDESAFYTSVTILLTAKTKEELEEVTTEIKTLAKREARALLGVHYLKQREALNTALPIGIRQIDTMRVLFGQPLAALMPFSVQELYDREGCYYGINQISKNIIFGNRRKLVNGNGFVFGVPGAGKSVFVKMEMGYIYLRYPKDQIIVIDPKNEYGDIAVNYGGAVINMDAKSNNYQNPFDVDLEKLGTSEAVGIVQEKSEFIISLCEQQTQNGLTPQEKSLLSRCVLDMYTEIGIKDPEERKMPTFDDFYAEMKQQPEREAKDLALLLEIFINGALSIFNHQTNIDMNARFKVYAIRDLGQQLWPMVMLAMMEGIQKQLIENYNKGIHTWLYVDEFHVLLDREYTANYMDQLWRKMRAQGGFGTGITQNISSVLKNAASKTMLANSEFVAILRQSKVEDEEFADAADISMSQLKYSLNARTGTGLLKCGSTIIPFDNTLDHNNPLYQMYNTNFDELQEQKELARKEG